LLPRSGSVHRASFTPVAPTTMASGDREGEYDRASLLWFPAATTTVIFLATASCTASSR